ncbi:MAG TPA: amidohydrolase family protein [Thermoguttaceae bacterium]|nr:amidohydrolase family protein [Thermoguttaceae bacterium]
MPSSRSVTRRRFLGASAAAGAALAGSYLGSSSPGLKAAETKAAPGAETPSRKAVPVIDCHAHLTHHSAANYDQRDRQLIEAADKLGIDRLCCSILTPKKPATAEGFRECNAWLAEAIERLGDRVLGYCYVNPDCGRDALDEIRRCVEDRGFIGVKLYNEHVCTEPIVYPIVELAIELRVPILHHAGHGHHPIPGQPNISDGGHLAELGRRYPEARLICAHVGGGGDWEWTIKALRHAPNVFLDTSGSVVDEGIVDMAAQVLGPDRLLFGCDMSMTAGVGKIRAARLSPEDRQKVLGGNMMRLLQMRG